MVRWTDRPPMTIAVDWDVKQQNKQTNHPWEELNGLMVECSTEIQESVVGASLEALYCVLEQDTLSYA